MSLLACDSQLRTACVADSNHSDQNICKGLVCEGFLQNGCGIVYGVGDDNFYDMPAKCAF